jgi:CRP-like cAMP-binding protein
MTRKATPRFDPKAFLAKANGGRTISRYRRNKIVFSQGDLADSVFYIHEGKVKVTVISEQGKEAVVSIMGPRRLSDRSTAAHGDSQGNDGMRDHAAGEGNHYSRPP